MATVVGARAPTQRDAKNPDDFAFGQIALYNSSMPRKEINFSQAREQFRALVEDVKYSGRPVTILRRGKPQAVLISYASSMASSDRTLGARLWSAQARLARLRLDLRQLAAPPKYSNFGDRARPWTSPYLKFMPRSSGLGSAKQASPN
jgi:prevent-host-death family protein